MKSINYLPNNQNKKRYFCVICNYSIVLPSNIKEIKCSKCGNILNEISEIDYQAKIFNYIKGNQQMDNKNMKINKFEDVKVNNIINDKNNIIINKLSNNIIIFLFILDKNNYNKNNIICYG